MSQKGISGTRRPGLNNEAIHGILGATGDQRHWDALSDQVPWCHIKKKNLKLLYLKVPWKALSGGTYWKGTFWGLSGDCQKATHLLLFYTHILNCITL